MACLDTSVIISFVDEGDPSHKHAEKVLKGLRKRFGEFYTTRLVLLELASVYSRAGLGKPLELAIYSINLVGGRLMYVDMNDVLRMALKLAPSLKMRALDLIHAISCKRIGGVALVTLDQEMLSKRDTLREVLDLEVMP
ncbi:MAG: PIN domain-containing protein [Candidatus Korarchaeota archaeon NZ13-K]|nr:MAG: PIN domain-containing protein [Candidatus Korarchaeota archaeon NZ13-K]